MLPQSLLLVAINSSSRATIHKLVPNASQFSVEVENNSLMEYKPLWWLKQPLFLILTQKKLGYLLLIGIVWLNEKTIR